MTSADRSTDPSREPAPAPPHLAAVRAQVTERGAPALALLAALVDQPSGSEDREGIARVLDRLGEELDRAGAAVELHQDAGLPRHLSARFCPPRAPGAPAPPRILLVGHADTVFPRSDRRTFAHDGERFTGPGATDMKGGLVIAIEAARAAWPLLRERGVEVELLINGDEELGSPCSRELVRERARGARAALVYENCERADGVIVGRKGLGWARIEIEGRAAHAGVNPEDGASALVEAAHQILDASRLNAPQEGVGVIVGLARGGRSRNTVPPDAELLIDIRYEDEQAATRAFAALRERGERTVVPGTRARFGGELHRPVMARGALGQAWLFELASRAAAATGHAPLAAVESGGGSDANLTTREGVPSLDGLGVVGAAIHTRREWGLVRSLGDRALLSAQLLWELAEGDEPPGGARAAAPAVGGLGAP